MLKRTTKLLIVAVAVLAVFSSCEPKIRYCEVTGCPKEAGRGTDYCYGHKCSNLSCTNKAIETYFYCEKCIRNAY